MKATVDELRRVAADMLRQGGDEVGARVVERVAECVHFAKVLLDQPCKTLGLQQKRWDHVAYLDPTWAVGEVDKAHEEALGSYMVPGYNLLLTRGIEVRFPTADAESPATQSPGPRQQP